MLKKFFISILLLLILSSTASASYNKVFYENNKTLFIKQVSNGNTLFTVQQISVESGITNFTEVFNITSYIASDYTFSSNDIGFSWNKFKGIRNITGSDFYLFQTSNYSVIVPDYIYVWENISREISCGFFNLSTCTIWDNVTVPIVSGNHTEIIDNSSWLKLNNLNGKVIKPGKSYIIKVIFHKMAGVGNFSIQTIPSFVGVLEDRMTWWNGSILYMVNNNIPNGTRPRTLELNISTLSVANNASWINDPRLVFQKLNETHWNVNFYVLNDNTTVETFYISDTSTNNGTANIFVKLSQNGSFQVYFGGANYSLNNSDAIQNSGNFGDRFAGTSLNLSKWTAGSSNIVVTGKLSSNAANIRSVQTFFPDMYLRIISRSPWGTDNSIGFISGSTAYRFWQYLDGGVNNLVQIANGSGVVNSNTNWNTANITTLKEFYWDKSNGTLAWYENKTEKTGSPYTVNADIPGSNMLIRIYDGAGISQDIYEVFAYQRYINESGWLVWGTTELPPPISPPIPIIGMVSTGDFYINTSWTNGTGIITDSYNSTNGLVWVNITSNYRNTTLSPHAWQNLSIYSFNSTYGLNTTPLINNSQIPDNAPVQSIIGNKAGNYGTWINFTITSTDVDGDILVYAKNATQGVLSGNAFSWLPVVGDTGNYSIKFNTTDNYSVVSNEETILISVWSNLVLISPANLSTTGSSSVTITWLENPIYPQYTYQIATDYQFLGIVTSGTTTTNSALVNLNPATLYYWRVKNATGTYTNWFSFTTPSAATTPGMLNITVLDEQNLTLVSDFTVQVYNSSYVILTKQTNTGWANFTSSEVSSGQYIINIIPNSTYARRSVLAISPTNVTVLLPDVTRNTVDIISFYIMDYTQKFPWTTSYLIVTKNNSVIHSSYFDADAKVTVYLIRGQSYIITLYNGNNIKQWGNYISIGNSNVQMVIMDSGFNSNSANPYIQYITTSNSNITLTWSSVPGTLISLNFSIYKGTMNNMVHNVVTSIGTGQSEYIVTNTSDIYYIFAIADTSIGRQELTKIIDYRSGTMVGGKGYVWTYGSYTVPVWVYSIFSMIVIILLAGSFGAMHRGEGAIIAAFAALFFAYKGWLSMYTGGIGMLIGLLLFAILYHLDSRRKGGY